MKKNIIVVGLLLLFAVIVIFLINRTYYPMSNPDYSENRSIKTINNVVTVNFKQCKPDLITISQPFGSTTIEVRGKSGEFCMMYVGVERENPNYDGRFTEKCKVPVSTGIKDYTQVKEYCSNL